MSDNPADSQDTAANATAGSGPATAEIKESDAIREGQDLSEQPAGCDSDPTLASGEEAELFDDLPPTPESEELIRLRELLFGREITFLDRLKAHLLGPGYAANKISSVLSEAILLRRSKDQSLNIALEPLVDEILKNSLHRHQTEFVNVLFPLMGPSIRRSIAETFRSMMDSFSKSLEMAFSWKGLRWRLEAMRTSKSFGEIVLLHTVVYRVEQVFFIHTETGLVLAHVTNEGVGSQDADMVSAMLTAIQDFARDCFAGGSSGGDLESLRMGEFTIFLVKSPQAYLACVVRGTPPSGFYEQLSTVLELMLVEYADELRAFKGDTEPFERSVSYLEGLLQERYDDNVRKSPLWAKAATIALLLLVIGGGAYWVYHSVHSEAQRKSEIMRLDGQKNAALDLLRGQPGLMVTSASEGAPPWQLVVMKDELAEAPEDILRGQGMDPDMFNIKTVPFISYDPAMVTKRAENSIAPLGTVHMEYTDNGTLVFNGTAPMLWMVQTREKARALPGVKDVDMTGLHDPVIEDISAKIREIESLSIRFPLGQDQPVPEDRPKLEKAVDTLVDLEEQARKMGFTMALTIYGHADIVGNEKRNYEISLNRTRTVATMLYARGASIPISMYGMGSQYPKEGGEAEAKGPAGRPRDDQESRRIELRVHMVRSATSSDMEWFR